MRHDPAELIDPFGVVAQETANFAFADDDQREAVRDDQERADEALAICFSGEAGKRALDHLRDLTLNVTTMLAPISETSATLSAGEHMCYREGQNSVLRYILAAIARHHEGT